MPKDRRLIDANALLKVLKHRVKGNEDIGIVLGTNSTLEIIEEWVRSIPTVDAVEVVRCKECNNWRDGVAGCTDKVKFCAIGYYMIGENGYCYFGERKVKE